MGLVADAGDELNITETGRARLSIEDRSPYRKGPSSHSPSP
jgi:hypothetical protein